MPLFQIIINCILLSGFIETGTESPPSIPSSTTTENSRYVDNGCHGDMDVTLDDVTGYFLLESLEAFVRCCSHDGLLCETISNCSDFGDQVNYANAVSKCKAIAKRLCTKDELLTGICCRTGGECDHYDVWT